MLLRNKRELATKTFLQLWLFRNTSFVFSLAMTVMTDFSINFCTSDVKHFNRIKLSIALNIHWSGANFPRVPLSIWIKSNRTFYLKTPNGVFLRFHLCLKLYQPKKLQRYFTVIPAFSLFSILNCPNCLIFLCNLVEIPIH